MAILEKKLDRPSGTLGCPIDELARMLGFRYVLACGRAVMWAPQGQKGLKKHFQRGPRAKGAENLKHSGQFGQKGSKATLPATYIFLQGMCGSCTATAEQTPTVCTAA